MQFIDHAVITVEAGSGGAGCLSFRREKYIPFGGPNGGDGGDGGSVYIVGHTNVNTLSDFNHKKMFKAQNGSRGSGSQKTGCHGEDLEIPVPLGTKIYHNETNQLLFDCVQAGERFLIAKGGFHGLGNTRFKTSVNKAPRHTTPGYPGEILNLRLELQLLADVGLIGLPNAGKSSTIRCVSQARPKVADYPFTTLVPQLGVVHFDYGKDLVLADIPGLIEGAHEGTGLGNIFLRHIARTRLLLFVLDTKHPEQMSCTAQYQLLMNELLHSNYKSVIEKLPTRIVFNKMDNDFDLENIQFQEDLAWFKEHHTKPVLLISALLNKGTDLLKQELYKEFFEEEIENFRRASPIHTQENEH
jgi:GTP-binding protein